MISRPTRQLGWLELLAYGSPALAIAALNLPLYVFLPTFYATELGLGLAWVGSILLAARLLDIVADPLAGILGDRTRSSFGRRRPWMVAAAPLLILATWHLFVPGEQVGIGYLFVWSTLAYFAWTVLLLAYNAWGAELSDDYHERSRVTMVREAFAIGGVILAAAMPALLGLPPASAAALEVIFWLMTIGLVGFLGLALWQVDEPLTFLATPHAPLLGLRLILQNRPFRRLVLAYLLNGVANGLPATLFILYVEHVLQAPTMSGPLLLCYFVSGMLATPLWLKLSYRLGKHVTWSASMVWASLVFAVVPFLGAGDVAWFFVICVLSGASLGADMALPASMQADVVDLDRAVTGQRRTGLFFALWSMATKLSLALAVGIAFPALELVGFTSSGANEPLAVIGLIGLYALLPVVIKLASIATIWNFELDAEKQRELVSLTNATKPIG